MRVLGIDPGSRITGYGLIDVVMGKTQYVSCGVIRMADKPFPQRLKEIFEGITTLLQTYAPEQVAIEQVFVQRNVRSALLLGQARGTAMVSCALHDLPIFEYSARQVKQSVVGYGNATKAQVQHMVQSLLHLSQAPSSDAADALAIAISHAHQQRGLLLGLPQKIPSPACGRGLG